MINLDNPTSEIAWNSLFTASLITIRIGLHIADSCKGCVNDSLDGALKALQETPTSSPILSLIIEHWEAIALQSPKRYHCRTPAYRYKISRFAPVASREQLRRGKLEEPHCRLIVIPLSHSLTNL